MLQERRKNRKINVINEQERQFIKNSHYQHKSAYKAKYSNRDYLETLEKSKRESPIVKVREEEFENYRGETIPEIKNSSPRKFVQPRR